MPVYIPRELVVGDRTLTEEELLRSGRVLVVLAEPGAGKTELLKSLAALLQTTRIRASIFRHKPGAMATGALVIDAMDEVARIDTIATDQIIALASERSMATVVFSSRSGEWDKGRTAFVEQCFGVEPIIVRLEPFNENEQRQLFTAQFPGEDFDAFTKEVERFELGPLLGNPQFLQLLGDAYVESGRVFTSKAKIFSDAVKRLAHEANTERGSQRARPQTDDLVALGGEMFAKLMLSGASGIATVEQLSDRDFPYINAVTRNAANAHYLVDTRLLKPSDDADKHEPVHRIVAEYSGADHLVKRIADPSDRLSLSRVMAIVAPNSVVRDELRGMLGWMAALGHETIQLKAIALDPYAVLANGDPSQLTSRAKRTLLLELEKLEKTDPLFRRSDLWRRFNVGRFFTPDIFDHVRTMLGNAGTLRNLVLELLISTDAAVVLAPELSELVKNAAADDDARSRAGEALLANSSYNPASDFAALLAEGSADSLEIAARWVTRRGVATFGAANVTALLEKLTTLYPPPNTRKRDGASLYFIEQLVRSFALDDITTFLDSLSAGLACTCKPKYEHRCTCRHGKSKTLGKLVDRYFELAAGMQHDPARVFQWIKALHFKGQVSSERSAAVRELGRDQELRRALQQKMIEGVVGEDPAHAAIMRLYPNHAHSGLHLHEGDAQALSDHAFANGMVDIWGALLVGHNVWNGSKAPSPMRAAQRKQGRTSSEFLAMWSRREHARRSYIRKERKVGRVRHKRYAQREADAEAKNRAHLRANLTNIEAGREWWWLKQFMRVYLIEPDKLEDLVDDPETPPRALRNCFPLLDQYIPTVEGLGRRERPDIAEVLLAACVVRFRDGENLATIDKRVLAAAKSEASSYPAFAKGEEEEFEAALDAALFADPGSAEAYLRAYMEQQLSATENTPQHVYWLDQKAAFQEFRATLPLEWLERFPRMPAEAARTLLGMAAKYANHDEFVALIDRRLADPVVDSGEDTDDDKKERARKKFWQLNAFLYNAPGSAAAWEELKKNPQTIFDLENRLGRLYDRDEGDNAPITAEKVFQIMDAFVEVWPKVHLPSSWGTGDPDDETAYRFLCDCIWKVADDIPAHRIGVLDRMLADPKFDNFKQAMLTLRAEAARKLALQDFRAPDPSRIGKLLDHNDVASVEDLRAVMVEQLGAVQQWLDGSETDPRDAFYSGGIRVDENTARNRIVDQLQGQMKALGLSVAIERHMAGGNRCDITAATVIDGAGKLLVTEVKGQWNSELYTAASAQLDRRYAIHPDAASQGVYLALWYGNGERVAGVLDPTIASAADLKASILGQMTDELKRRVDVVVLDISRAVASPKTPKATGKTKGKPRAKAKRTAA